MSQNAHIIYIKMQKKKEGASKNSYMIYTVKSLSAKDAQSHEQNI